MRKKRKRSTYEWSLRGINMCALFYLFNRVRAVGSFSLLIQVQPLTHIVPHLASRGGNFFKRLIQDYKLGLSEEFHLIQQKGMNDLERRSVRKGSMNKC